MKDKKGFTLIELLTVIAILAIILLIAAPTILGVLDKAKKNTFKNQVLLYVESLKQQVALTALNQADMSITLPDVGGSTTVNIADIPMDTSTGLKGSIRIENSNGNYKYILVSVSNDDYKINKEVEAKALGTNDIEKNDGTSSTPEIPTITYSHRIGDEVTLKDGSTWYVIENSDSSSSTLTLFASQNMKNDASGWTTEPNEYVIPFDEASVRTTENNSYCTNPADGCNIYAANGTTVTEDSSIKKFIDGSVKDYINNSLTSNGGTSINSIRLLTKDEYDTLDSSITRNSTWYWTMTPYESNSNKVYIITYNGILYSINAYYVVDVGARPVIVTTKSNIK